MVKKKVLEKYVSKGPYSVVLFKEQQEKLYEVIPEIWFTDEEKLSCYWPPKSGKSVTLRAMNGEAPDDDDWEICACEVISEGHVTYSSGSLVVREKCSQKYNTSSADEHIEAARFRREHPGLLSKGGKSFEDVFAAPKAAISSKISRSRSLKSSRGRSPETSSRCPSSSSSVDRFRSDKRQSISRCGTIDRSLSRVNSLKSKIGNATENQTVKSKSPVIPRSGRSRSVSRRLRTVSGRSRSESTESRSLSGRSRSGSSSNRSGARSRQSGARSSRNGLRISRIESRSRRSESRSSRSVSRTSRSEPSISRSGQRSSRSVSRISRSESRRRSRSKSQSYSRNRSRSNSRQRTHRYSQSSGSVSSFHQNARSNSRIQMSSSEKSCQRMELNLKEVKDMVVDSNNKQVRYAHENDRRFTRLEVTINKMFIMLASMAHSHIPTSTTASEKQKPPKGFKMPDIPLDSTRELRVLHRKLKDENFRSFLLYHEKEFCSPPDTSLKLTPNVVMTAYLKRFISLRLRSSLTLKDLKGKEGETLCDDYRRVYQFLIDVMKEGYKMSNKSISFDEVHGVLRVVWGRSKQLLKDQEKKHRKDRKHKKTNE